MILQYDLHLKEIEVIWFEDKPYFCLAATKNQVQAKNAITYCSTVKLYAKTITAGYAGGCNLIGPVHSYDDLH